MFSVSVRSVRTVIEMNPVVSSVMTSVLWWTLRSDWSLSDRSCHRALLAISRFWFLRSLSFSGGLLKAMSVLSTFFGWHTSFSSAYQWRAYLKTGSVQHVSLYLHLLLVPLFQILLRVKLPWKTLDLEAASGEHPTCLSTLHHYACG